MAAYSAAIQLPGPRSKLWADRNAMAGVVLHSAEGTLPVALSMLADEGIPVSWHFSIGTDGTVYQHYDLADSPWHAGSLAQNRRLIGIEHEGVAGEPLTLLQLAASIALVQWIAGECGWQPQREGAGKTLWEHNEISRTTCPSGRIPWDAYLLPRNLEVFEEEPMRTRALDQGESIAAFNAIAVRLGMTLNDQAGETVVEVIDPPPPAGYVTYAFTVKRSA